VQKRISQLFTLFVDGVSFALISLSLLLRPLLSAGFSEVEVVINYVYKRLSQLPNSIYLDVHKGVFPRGVAFRERLLLQFKKINLYSELFVVVI